MRHCADVLKTATTVMRKSDTTHFKREHYTLDYISKEGKLVDQESLIPDIPTCGARKKPSNASEVR